MNCTQFHDNMSVPPDRVTVKRRRDEAPVDALFIQQKKHRPSALWIRLEDGDSSPQYADVKTCSTAEKPTIAVDGALPCSTKHLFSVSVQDARSTPFSRSGTQQSVPGGHPLSVPYSIEQRRLEVRHPRRFHLAPSASRVPSPHSASTGGVQKPAKRREGFLAVFVEKDQRSLVGSEQGSLESRLRNGGHLRATTRDEQPESSPVRKRPIINAAEQARKDATQNTCPRTRVSGDKTLDQGFDETPTENQHSEVFAAQLERFALETIKVNQQETEIIRSDALLKFKPKPPKPRKQAPPSHESGIDMSLAENDQINDDVEFVYDTYIQGSISVAELMPSSRKQMDPISALDDGRIGILVIEEEEELLWETFGQSADSEPEGDSGEEDENAEDYYGNDYPEDEVSSDDEYDRGAYRFRIDASDDEEFDADTIYCSDGGDNEG